jgi:hypothetical protein
MYHPQTQTLDTQGNPTKPVSIDEKPWEILRLCLIWYLWCQKCEYDVRNGDFHIGVALFHAWQTIVQTAMEAWYDLTKYNSDKPKLAKQRKKEKEFIDMWSYRGIFCRTDNTRIRWQIVPHANFSPGTWRTGTKVFAPA